MKTDYDGLMLAKTRSLADFLDFLEYPSLHEKIEDVVYVRSPIIRKQIDGNQ